MRRFNWKLLIVILIGLAVLATTAFGLHFWQKRHMAKGRLDAGNRAYAMRQWEQAASDFGKYIAVTGDTDVPVLLKYAQAQLNIRPLKRDNIHAAVSIYGSILRLQPDNCEVSNKLIQLYLEMGMYGESELIARRQLEGIHDPNIQRLLVVALAGQRKFEEAAAELNIIIKAHPDDVLSYEALSRLCEQRPEEFNNAQYWLDEAVRQNPSSAMAYIVRGAFEFRKGKADQAAADFEHAQTLDLSKADTRLRLTRELVNAGKLSTPVCITKNLSAGRDVASRMAAEKVLRKALAADQNSPELISELAELLYVSGRLPEAMDLYQRLVELDPENLTAINNLAWIMCEDMGKHAQALELAQKGLSISPDCLDLIDTRGMAYFRLGKLDNSIADFTKCAKLYPDHLPSAVASYFHLGRAFAASAKKKEAVKYLKMALESNQKNGGLSVNDVAEAHNLLDGLLKG